MGRRSRAHPGVGVSGDEGRWRLRWREAGRSRSWVVRGPRLEAHRWAMRISELLAEGLTFDPPAEHQVLAGDVDQVPDLREVLLAWSEWRARAREVSAGTQERDRSALRRIELEVRAELGLGERDPIPVTVLSVELADGIHRRLIASGVGRSRQGQVLGALWAAWSWGVDVGRWPALPAAPRTRELVVPRVSRARRPMPAPTVAEMDAIVLGAREVARCDSSLGAIYELQRGTGLRLAQVIALEARDVRGLDSPVPTLDVRVGKTRAEKAGRTVPLAPVLVPLMRKLVEGRAPEDRLVRSPGQPTMMRVLEHVEGEGLVRPEVWRTPDRGNARLSHWARAGFQRLLRRAGVEDRVIDVLVGHGGRTVRDRHYDAADWAELVDAVRRVPPIAESATAAQAPVELLGRHRR